MRKQYHFQPSENGFYTWDVDKLVGKSKNFPVISVKLDEIKELDENFWYMEKTKPTPRSIVNHFKLMNETDLKYPVILGADGRVMDGMHRLVKALFLGHKEIKAVLFNEDPEPDYKNVLAKDLPY